MQPRISSKDAQAMRDAYAKIYAPPEKPVEEPVDETEVELSDEIEENETEFYDDKGNILDLDDLETEEIYND